MAVPRTLAKAPRAVKRTGRRAGGAIAGAGGAVVGAGKRAGGAVAGAGKRAGGAVVGAGKRAGGAVAGAGKRAGGAVVGAGKAAGRQAKGAGRMLAAGAIAAAATRATIEVARRARAGSEDGPQPSSRPKAKQAGSSPRKQEARTNGGGSQGAGAGIGGIANRALDTLGEFAVSIADSVFSGDSSDDGARAQPRRDPDDVRPRSSSQGEQDEGQPTRSPKPRRSRPLPPEFDRNWEA